MTVFVSRRPDGSIYGRFTVKQHDGQEELRADHPDLLALDLTEAKAARRRDVAVHLHRVMAAGFTWQGVVFQLDDASQNRIATLAVKAARAVDGRPGAWDEAFRFIAADNSEVAFTATEFGLFADAASSVVIARHMNARALKNAILTAGTAEQLAAIDITAGWD